MADSKAYKLAGVDLMKLKTPLTRIDELLLLASLLA